LALPRNRSTVTRPFSSWEGEVWVEPHRIHRRQEVSELLNKSCALAYSEVNLVAVIVGSGHKTLSRVIRDWVPWNSPLLWPSIQFICVQECYEWKIATWFCQDEGQTRENESIWDCWRRRPAITCIYRRLQITWFQQCHSLRICIDAWLAVAVLKLLMHMDWCLQWLHHWG